MAKNFRKHQLLWSSEAVCFGARLLRDEKLLRCFLLPCFKRFGSSRKRASEQSCRGLVWPFDLIGWLCKLVTINLKTRLIGWISILSRGFVTFDVIISAKITVFSVVVFDYINIRYTVQKRYQNSLCISYTVYDIHYIIMYLSLLWWLVGKLVSFRCWFLLVRIFLFSLK